MDKGHLHFLAFEIENLHYRMKQMVEVFLLLGKMAYSVFFALRDTRLPDFPRFVEPADPFPLPLPPPFRLGIFFSGS